MTKKLTNLTNYDITNGASGQNIYLRIPFEVLLERLGKPTMLGSADNKVQLEWVYSEKTRTNAEDNYAHYKTLTIYDWKENRPFHEISEWNVGAKNLNKNEIIEFLKTLGFDPVEEIVIES